MRVFAGSTALRSPRRRSAQKAPSHRRSSRQDQRTVERMRIPQGSLPRPVRPTVLLVVSSAQTCDGRCGGGRKGSECRVWGAQCTVRSIPAARCGAGSDHCVASTRGPLTPPGRAPRTLHRAQRHNSTMKPSQSEGRGEPSEHTGALRLHASPAHEPRIIQAQRERDAKRDKIINLLP